MQLRARETDRIVKLPVLDDIGGGSAATASDARDLTGGQSMDRGSCTKGYRSRRMTREFDSYAREEQRPHPHGCAIASAPLRGSVSPPPYRPRSTGVEVDPVYMLTGGSGPGLRGAHSQPSPMGAERVLYIRAARRKVAWCIQSRRNYHEQGSTPSAFS